MVSECSFGCWQITDQHELMDIYRYLCDLQWLIPDDSTVRVQDESGLLIKLLKILRFYASKKA